MSLFFRCLFGMTFPLPTRITQHGKLRGTQSTGRYIGRDIARFQNLWQLCIVGAVCDVHDLPEVVTL
jgi:hypothetical protein